MIKDSGIYYKGLTLFLFIILIFTAAHPAASQSQVTSVIVTGIQINDTFPEIRVQVKPLDTNGELVQGLVADQFSLKEDGITIPAIDVVSGAFPVNAQVVFIIDELSISSRLPFVRDAIQSFARDAMKPGDTVIVLAAQQGGKTQTIIPITNDPDRVINGMNTENYDPASASGSDLLETVNQGLNELELLNKDLTGKTRVVVFSVSIIDQLELNKTIDRANDLTVPIYTVLLGTEDAKGALGRLAQGTGAGAGAIPADDIGILNNILDLGDDELQYQITYRSKITSAGDHTMAIQANGIQTNNVTFTLEELEPPIVEITSPNAGTVITRTETLFNQNSDNVEPTEQTVAAEVIWPDGHPREISTERTTLVVNGKAVGSATVIRDNGKDLVFLEFTWDLRDENTPGANSISLIVEVEDELGLKSRSLSQEVAVDYVVFGGEETCPGLILDYSPGLCSNWNLILSLASLGVAVIALVLVISYLRRNPKVQKQVKERLLTMVPGRSERLETKISAEDAGPTKVILQVLEGDVGNNRKELRINTTTSIGRSSDHAQLVLQGNRDHSPISRLHCTILEKEDGFEVRDESSANGTFLNDIRLAPGKAQELKDGDLLELAKVRDGGVKLKFQAGSPPVYMKTRMVAPPSAEPEDKISPDGYTPTKPMN